MSDIDRQKMVLNSIRYFGGQCQNIKGNLNGRICIRKCPLRLEGCLTLAGTHSVGSWGELKYRMWRAEDKIKELEKLEWLENLE